MTREDVAIVTGASSGIGLATATLLAARGFTVYGTSRGEAGSPSGRAFDMLRCDVRSDASVAECVDEVVHRQDRVDLLVNCAGYQLMGACEETTLDEARAQFDTNFFGAVRMIDAVLPVMRRRRRGHIVNVTSVFGFMGAPFMGFYTASKHALEGYSEVLRHEVAPFGVHVSIVEPAATRTAINGANQYTRRLPEYEAPRERALEFIAQSVDRGGADPADVARTIAGIAESPHPRRRYRAGRQALAAGLSRRLLPDALSERIVRRMFHAG